ncbi:hypothetical protein OnM2_093015 [Erysiphe neolycopersici]|uniref:Uncharacterized protein n=1 Tax=Erysiphe neolycopersici TaxID=212602 RepID=A0A420HC30_9PEZI|nr:hypothetical protein OnM2_093015 [Erysiphe neolycopersici]
MVPEVETKFDVPRPLKSSPLMARKIKIFGQLLLNLHDIVFDGYELPDDADSQTTRGHPDRLNQAAAIYIDVVWDVILEKIVEFRNPHLMWTYLRNEHFRDNAFALVFQMSNLSYLSSSYDSPIPLSSFIRLFEGERLYLLNLAKTSTDSYGQLITSFLPEDQAERNFLLRFLVRIHKKIIDNVTTKDSVSFSDVKIRLLDLDSANSTDTALAIMGGGNKQ